MNTSLSRLLAAWCAALLHAPAAAAQPDGSGWGSAAGVLALIVLLAAVWALLRRVQRLRGAAQRSAAPQPPQYKPEKVGNDASARPWEEGAAGGGAPQAVGGAGIPAGFDAAAFLEAAKESYTKVQRARSSADAQTLRALLSEDAFAQALYGGQPPRGSEVLTLQARLLGVKAGEGAELASVEFSGMAGADATGGWAPFREVWSMERPADGQGAWRVADIQSLAV